MTEPEHRNNASGELKFARVLFHPVCLGLLLAAVTLLVYWPVMRCGFVNYDDPDYYSANPQVQGGLTAANVAWAFRTDFASNWHPLTWLSLMLDRQMYGPGPAGPHFTNLLLHLANTVLLFWLLRRMTSATWRSALVAALFALHPLHVESVAWISERKDVLSALFGLLALWFYAGYARRVTGGKWQMSGDKRTSNIQHPTSNIERQESCIAHHASHCYFLCLFSFALGLMSKPMLVTLPFVLLLLDYWPLKRFTIYDLRFTILRLIREKVPFFLLSAVSCVVTYVIQQQSGAVTKLARITLTGRIENTFVAYGRYLDKTLWPVSLANPYPHPGHWEMSLVIYSVALVFGLSAITILFARRFPFFFTGWFWFVGTLIPVIGLVQVGVQSMADRYTYLPLIGVFIIFAWGLAEANRWRQMPKTGLALLAVLVLLACAGRTRDQLSYWRNNEALFRHTLAVTQNNYVAYNNLGTWLAKDGRTREALDCFIQSLRVNPDDPDVLYNLGNALARLGDPDGAVRAYRRANELAPDHADVLNNLGFALADQEHYDEAIACFEQALRLKPDYADAHNNLANVLYYRHQYAESVQHFRAAQRLVPDNALICCNLGDALLKVGQTNEAVRWYQEALRLKPGSPKIKAKLQTLEVPASN
jgi:protein O-mannosyl-transferase